MQILFWNSGNFISPLDIDEYRLDGMFFLERILVVHDYEVEHLEISVWYLAGHV